MATYYPIPVYNYRVRMGASTLSFTEVSGLQVQHDELVYRDGMSFLLDYVITRGFSKEIKVTLKKGVIASDSTQPGAADMRNLHKAFFDLKKQDIEIDLVDQSAAALVTWVLVGAVPMGLELPSLDANSNNVAIETLTFTARELRVR